MSLTSRGNKFLYFLIYITAVVICYWTIAFIPENSYAAEWSGNLRNGGRVTVDPQTNRATYRNQGVQSQLWDGVHQLEDGSHITVHSGQVIPNPGILNARRLPDATEDEQWRGASIVGYSPCERLTRRVCGDDFVCADQPGCLPARQLLEMESNERAKSYNPNLMTYTSGQCQKAEADKDLFTNCIQE